MITNFETVHPDDGLFDVQQKLAQSQLEALPVSEGGQFLGLITQQDVAEIFQLASSQSNLLSLLGTEVRETR
jgi:signal-transduction protein with cAMP-binding, CBS, and nucleotidyltransferase domain